MIMTREHGEPFLLAPLIDSKTSGRDGDPQKLQAVLAPTSRGKPQILSPSSPFQKKVQEEPAATAPEALADTLNSGRRSLTTNGTNAKSSTKTVVFNNTVEYAYV